MSGLLEMEMLTCVLVLSARTAGGPGRDGLNNRTVLSL